jgi:hypothetical protein
MTFDELFQYYADMGITSRPEGIMTVAPITNTVQPIIPVQQPVDRGGDNNTPPPDTTNNAGIYSVSDAVEFIKNLPTPMNLARMGLQGLNTLVGNIQNPYTTFTGALQPDVQENIKEDIVRDMAKQNERDNTGGYQGGYGGGFMGGSGTSAEMGSF